MSEFIKAENVLPKTNDFLSDSIFVLVTLGETVMRHGRICSTKASMYKLEEISLVAPFLSRQIDIPKLLISSILAFEEPSEHDLLSPRVVLIPRAPLQIINNIPSQCSNHINTSANCDKNSLHIIPKVAAPDRIK